MKRSRKIGLFAALGVVAGILLAILAVGILTRTQFGAERVRRFAVTKLQEHVQGLVRVGRISGPGLLGGLTLHEISIQSPEGRDFLSADSIKARYNWRTLLSGRIVLQAVDLYHPRFVLEQLPGDTVWNIQEIFPPRPPGPPGAKRRDIILEDVRIHHGYVIVRSPYHPKEPAKPGHVLLEEVPGGTVRLMHFDDINARFDRVVWQSSIETGRLFQVRTLSGLVYLWSDTPAVIRQLSDARVTWRDSIISFNARNVQLPSSRADVTGTVVMREGRNYFDVQIDGRQVAFSDLQWIDRGIPKEGTVTAQLRIQTQEPKGTLWYLRDARVTAPGTRLAGTVGVVTGDTLYFTQVNLRAQPLNLDFLKGLLPASLPIEGLLVGTVEVTGPMSNLDIKGDVQYRERAGAPQSSVRLAGRFDVRDGVSAREMQADVTGLDLALLHAFRPDLALPGGRVTGHVAASAIRNQPFRFAAELHHQLAGLSSSVSGGGTWDSRSRLLDLRLNALPVSFEQLAHEYPALAVLDGEARGPVTLRGSLDDLTVDAQLQTSGGAIDLDGRLRHIEGRRRYEGEGRVSGFQLDRLLPAVPLRDLTGTIRFDLTGTSTDDVNGSIAVALDSASVSNVPLRNVTIDARASNGLLTVDTARAFTPAGFLTAHGTFGIGADAEGELAMTLLSDSAVPQGLFAETGFGRAEVTGVLRGNASAFELVANAALADLRRDRMRAHRLSAAFNLRHTQGQPLGYRATVAADTLTMYGQDLSTGTLQIESVGGVGRAVFDAGALDRAYRVSADFRNDSNGTEVFVRDVRAGSLGQPWVLASPFRLVYSAPSVQIDSFVLARSDGKGSVQAAGRLGWGETVPGALPLDFRLTFDGLPLRDYVRVLRDEATTEGTANGSLTMGGVAHDPVMQARIDIDGLRYGNAILDRAGATMTYASRAVNLRVEADRNGRRVLQGDGRIPLDLAFLALPARVLDEPMQLSLRADSMPAAVPAGLVDGFDNVGGWINGNLQFRGTPVDPTMGGIVRLAGGSATFLPFGVHYRDANAALEVLDDSLVALTATARADQGSTRLAGKINFGQISDPIFDLSFDATDFPAAHRSDVDAITSGRFHLGGRYSEPVITGRINIDRGALYLDELYRQYQIVQLDSAVIADLFPVIDTSLVALRPILRRSNNPFLRNLVVRDLQLDVRGDSWMRSRALNVQVAGQLDVAFERAKEDLRLTGSLQAIRGSYLMEYRPIARRFDIREGTVEFPGTPGLDPDLSFRAGYRARPANGSPIDIVAVVSGTMRAPRVRLESGGEENLGESDLASYLFFGMPTSALSSSQSRTLQGSMFGSLGLESLSGYLSGGLQTVAQDFGLLDYVSLTAAEAAIENRQQGAIASIFQNTQIEFGRNLFGPDLFVIWSQRLASSSQPGVRLEWRFNPTYTAEFFLEDRFARHPSFGLDRTQKTVYGFFLFREWGR